MKSQFKILLSIIIAFVASIFLVGIVMQAIAVFDSEMLLRPIMLVPIVIVGVPTYMFVYWALFKKKRDRD